MGGQKTPIESSSDPTATVTTAIPALFEGVARIGPVSVTCDRVAVNCSTALQEHGFQFDEFNADLNQQLVDVVAVWCVAVDDKAMQ